MEVFPNIRKGCSEDEDWLFQLFRKTMQDYIDKAWGWDELLQREGFVTSLPARNFAILELNGTSIGSYYLADRANHFLLEMILVAPEDQRRGFGSLMMKQIKHQSREHNKPVWLSVLKTNPAIQFHLANGFRQVEEDEHSIRMMWP
ncbi:MAG: GNAT family N-acetyltransferase [Gammaproteobacteria bacterium]|jgi:N-acetylglutamate synthase-like GNAT family acetyltransferase|nr:GNAT family N-acetyltransferase [Gammaproteobacteria bacterium]